MIQVYSTKRIDITTEENGVYETTDNFDANNYTIVNASHYGASDLRKALQAMAPGNSNTDYFTSAEQELMNSTTVTTKDTRNNVTYTTTDKLYALAADGYNATTIKAGSDDSTLLAMSSYWSTGKNGFWLRSPYEKSVFIALLADPGGNVDCEGDLETKAIQPASNLNLSSVLFASAATAATSSDTAEQGTITDGTAMTLRLDGKEKKIGTAIYNTATGDIKVAKGSTTGDVALVVQGNDGTNDWYYSKKIDTTETETVNASTIKSTLSLSSDIDLSSCKIWLETTSADDGMTYAVSAEEEIEAINTTYATKEQLMKSFKPYSDGTATNIGKLVFGKNSSGGNQEWYILGKDDGVTGDNTILFAASPIATEKPFNSSTGTKTIYTTTDEYGVYKTTGSFTTSVSTTVNANHYGASDLRATLQGMATNSSYFTSSEQKLMNPTTVTTKDTANNVTYTTTDILYALTAEGYGGSYTTIKAGSNDSTVLAMSSYWNSGEWFWLRSPFDEYGYFVLRAYPRNFVYFDNISGENAVQPASNLNLSSVLFASAAAAASSDTAVSGEISDGTAMTLRLDGTEKKIGTAIYNASTGDIKATKGSTTGDVALVVQGNDGTNDWYYSKKIDTTETETVNASTIKSTLSLSSDIDLSSCKIWLETTSADDGMTYAVSAEEEIEAINTTYATKEQLMKSFKPYSDGTATNIGKLVFGKNSSGVAQEWYILGQDDGVTGDNTILFAASPIATAKQFDSSTNSKDIDTTTETCGVYKTTDSFTTSASTTVNVNHYGASDLRAALQGMATNSSYFTSSEQKLMNPTTVTTKDTANNVTYTTTDILYALTAEGYSSSYTTIKAGSNDSTVLAMSSYWNSGEWFWLRSPFDTYGYNVLRAYPRNFVYFDNISGENAVQPASNLNLSSVLFASAAAASSSDTAVSGEISDGTAMTLRLDGTEKKIGTAIYNASTGDIKATKESTTGDVALVVQGNDGTNDWYYSKQITGTEVLNVDDLVSETNTPSSIDLSSCKIWLETTDSTKNLTYAVEATETTIQIIHSVAITGIDTPVSNNALDTEASCATTGVRSTTPQITWTEEGGSSASGTAGYNTAYTASITLTADTGYEFIDSTTATVSDYNATGVTNNADGTFTVTYAFPATAKDTLKSITAQSITVANGTAYADMHLPTTVNIVTEGGTESSAAVQWDTTTPASGSYNPAVLTEQTVTLKGTVTCPETIDANGVSLATTITITVSAAGIVGAPTADIPAGTYTENQSATLTSSTEGATIYYTTDGSEPTLTDGAPNGTTTEYTAPISVTGTEGQSITTTIKAIAVKSGMQDSEVETFAYTIAVPVTKYTITASAGTNGTISTAGAVTVAAGEPATFTITAGGDDLTYQWQINRNDGKGWVDIEGAIAASYTTAATDASYNGNQYKCVITSNMGIVESEVITLTVDDTDSKDTGNKDTGNKDTDSKDADNKDADSKDADSKDTDSKDADSKDADNKDTDSKDADNKETDSKDTDNKDTDSKETDNKDTDSKETDDKDTDNKDTDGNAGSESREVKVTKISTKAYNHHLAVKHKLTLKTTVTPSNASNKGVTYTCSNTKYATVNKKGVVTAKKAGGGKTVIITVTAKDGSGVKATYEIKISKRAVTSIKVTAPKTAKAGSKVKLKSKVTPNKRVCTVVSYKCLTPEYASVSSKGVVKIRENAVGKTIKIRVKARDGSNKKKIVRIKITK